MRTIKCTLTFPGNKVVVLTASNKCPEGDINYEVEGDRSLLGTVELFGPISCLEPTAEAIAEEAGATLDVQDFGIYDYRAE